MWFIKIIDSLPYIFITEEFLENLWDKEGLLLKYQLDQKTIRHLMDADGESWYGYRPINSLNTSIRMMMSCMVGKPIDGF